MLKEVWMREEGKEGGEVEERRSALRMATKGAQSLEDKSDDDLLEGEISPWALHAKEMDASSKEGTRRRGKEEQS